MPPAKKAAAKEEKKVHPRDMTAAQRREALLKSRKDLDDDYRVLKSDDEEVLVPYGMLAYDHVLKLNGIGFRGRVSQIHGNEGSCKSTSSYRAVANFQRFSDEPAAIFDFERTCTVPYLRFQGVNVAPNMCFLKQPDSLEDCQANVLDLLESGVRLFVFDSIPRMKSKVSAKDIRSGAAFKASYGTHAKAMSQFYDNMLPYAAEFNAHFIMINQTRDRIEEGNDARNAQKYPTFTNLPYTLPGGRACRFVPSVMIENKMYKAYKPGPVTLGSSPDDFILEPATPENKDLVVATRIRVRTLKNKVGGGGYREAYVWNRPVGVGRTPGLDENISIREYARMYGLIDYTGGGKNQKWFVGVSPEEALITYGSKAEAIQDLVLNENPQVLSKLKLLVAKAIDADSSGQFATTIDENEASYLEGVKDFEGDQEEKGDGVASSSTFVIDEEI